MNFVKGLSSLIFLISCLTYKPAQSTDEISSFITGKLEEFTDDVVFSEKCFEELGCFSNGPPYFDIKERPISLLPQDRDTIGTAFYLYTRQSRNACTHFTNANVTANVVQDAGFQGTRRSVFIVHGYSTESFEEWMVAMKDGILDIEDANVFIVAWFQGSDVFYGQAVANSRIVGAEIALLVSKLQEAFRVEPENLYLIGHSLGAHAAGYAGKRIPNLGRITGLDPAGPGFQNVDSSIRLNCTDALLVDNIHTNAASNFLFGYGTTENIGDLDFIVNGGSQQPGCQSVSDHAEKPTLSNVPDQDKSCSHGRVLDLMISSIKIRDCFLVNLNCNSLMKLSSGDCGNCDGESSLQPDSNCIEMGYFADEYETDRHLVLYTNTTENEPFCTNARG